MGNASCDTSCKSYQKEFTTITDFRACLRATGQSEVRQPFDLYRRITRTDYINRHGDPQSNSSWDNGPKKSEFRTVLSPNQSPYGDLDQTFPSSLETNRGTLRQRPDLKWPSLSGWQGGVAASAATVVLVLLVNVGIVIWVSLHFPINAGIATLLQGDCRRSKRWALWLHLFINALSTMLLAVSNYTMQCLHAPTRREVDRAHKQGKWLAIGLPSLRNITSVSWKRSALFLLLTMSSVPLHLMSVSDMLQILVPFPNVCQGLIQSYSRRCPFMTTLSTSSPSAL